MPESVQNSLITKGLIIVPYSINGIIVPQELRFLYAKKFLKNNWCIWYYSSEFSAQMTLGDCGCYSAPNPKKNKKNEYGNQFTFNTFKWTKASIMDTVRFKVASLLGVKESEATQPTSFTNIPSNLEVNFPRTSYR